MHCGAQYSENELIAVPNKIIIYNLSLKQNVIDHFKLDRYIFPKYDHGPTQAGKLEISPIKCLEYIVNLSLHRVPYDSKQVWDNLAGQDNFNPEISKVGMQATRFDLRQLTEQFKRKNEKQAYIKRIGGFGKQGAQPKIVGKFKDKSSTNILPDSDQQCAKINCAVAGARTRSPSLDNVESSLNISATEAKIRTLPNLLEFTEYCRNHNLSIIEKSSPMLLYREGAICKCFRICD